MPDQQHTLQAQLRKALAKIAHLASDAQDEWQVHEPLTPLAEYQRGYMNAADQALSIIQEATNVLR